MIESYLLKNVSGYIEGQWVDADSGETVEVLNPANGKTLAEIPKMGTDETERAIAAAKSALASFFSSSAEATAFSVTAGVLPEAPDCEAE